MRKLQVISLIFLAAGVAGLILWGMSAPFPDWAVRAMGIVLIVALFVLVYTTVKIRNRNR